MITGIMCLMIGIIIGILGSNMHWPWWAIPLIAVVVSPIVQLLVKYMGFV
jgi:hypothetical protein